MPMPFEIIRSDITKLRVDAVVNAANTALEQGGGVCGAIFAAAGAKELTRACSAIGHVDTGGAVITPGFLLSAKYIIHTAGPVWHGGTQGEREQLMRCYTQSLRLARENGCESIAFPLISAGIYGYPKAQALRVAADAIRAFLATDEEDMAVYLSVYDKDAFSLSRELHGHVRSYIDDVYVEEHTHKQRMLLEVERSLMHGDFTLQASAGAVPAPAMPAPAPSNKSLDTLVNNLDESFSQTLLRLIDLKGKTDAQVYKRANIDRRHFSKIRCEKGYMPSKRTALALCIALELNADMTRSLLARAGYTLSRSQKLDVIVEYFIQEKNYDIFAINEALFYFDQPLLGG